MDQRYGTSEKGARVDSKGSVGLRGAPARGALLGRGELQATIGTSRFNGLRALFILVSDSSPVSSISISISGIPVGMSFALSGSTIYASWPKAIAGTYSLKVSVTDSLGRSSSVAIPVTVRS